MRIYRIAKVLAVVFCMAGASTANAQPIDFAHEVLPLLKTHCAECHSNGTYKGGFSLDDRDALIGSEVLKLGHADESEMFERVISDDPDERMPPKGDGLSKKEVDILRRWINQKAPWTDGFSFKAKTWKAPLAPRRPKLPEGNGNPIDRILTAYFKANQTSFPKSVDDRVFIRRVYLDLVGVLPTIQEQERFLNTTETDKREKLVDELLGRRRDYADHWMTFWNDLLRNDYNGTGFIDGGRKQITAWLHQALYENKPYDQFVRELIAPPNGESDGFIRGIQWRGNVNASQVREVQFAQNVSQVFLGENLKCASCHDSFINDWKLKDAYGMASILSNRSLEMYRCDKPTGKKADPAFLWPELGEIPASFSQTQRLQSAANLITKKENGRFARTIVNRIWKQMMGRGIVEPVDMMSNRPFSEDLLDYLAIDLVDHRYDLKRTMKLIATSKIYQAQTVSEKSETDERTTFRGPIMRRMTAEQFLDSVWRFTRTGPRKLVARIANYDGKSVSQKFADKWIWDRENPNDAAPNETISFESVFELSSRPKSGKVVITCDNYYLLIVNGNRINEDSDWTTVELLDIGKHLLKGKNKILLTAKNLGDTPNPAGLYCSIFVDHLHLPAKFSIIQDEKRTPAVALKNQSGWQNVSQSIHQKEQQAMGRDSGRIIRASLVTADPLMRSLGRPNREQVVTTRIDQLSTLQALDLSNGQIMNDLMERGASRFEKSISADGTDAFINNVYQQLLCRMPTKSEQSVLKKILGQKPDRDAVADFLWIMVMLPEFQHVR